MSQRKPSTDSADPAAANAISANPARTARAAFASNPPSPDAMVHPGGNSAIDTIGNSHAVSGNNRGRSR